MDAKTVNKESLIYVINQDFQIVYSNDKLRQNVPEVEYGRYCYELIGGEQQQCARCPLRKENEGQLILFSELHREWLNANTATIQWPGVDGDCYMIMLESVESNSKNLFYSAVENADYDEMLRLNYLEDTYTILYHGEQQRKGIPKTGKISEMVRSTAEKLIHPEDRERFCEFWLLDKVGEDGVPHELLNMYHGEFRRRMPDGNYIWAQQVFMPTRQSTENELYVMNFYNIIGAQNQWDERVFSTLKEIWEQGICNKQTFFKKADELLKQSKDGTKWCMVAMDIEGLKLFNEWYGRSAGDELLVGIANCLNRMQAESPKPGIVGYFGNDDFAVLMEDNRQKIQDMYSEIMILLKFYNKKTGFLPSFGVYEIDGSEDQTFAMYDRAEIARTSIRGNYASRIRRFDEEMLEKMESRMVLFSDIQKALANNEFTFFLQPKCNMENGKVVGAEALVRWVSREKGIISPGVFIPFLESSGLIAEVDTYIWEEVCKWQRSVIDRGIEPIPVSVNVSRVDIYTMDVSKYFAELVRKYDLDPKLIEIEITESVYSKDYEVINSMVEELRNSGFCILMDDFGSGYSSLNMLKDIEVDILKIDMRFLNIAEEKQNRGIGIIETVYNMARLMGIGVVVEGVETAEQKAFLLEMGCGYGQGYYFYRPIPVNDFEKIIEDSDNRDTEGFRTDKNQVLDLKDLFSDDMFSEIMLNNIVGAVAFYDICGDRILVTKCNENYHEMAGGSVFAAGTALDVLQHIDAEYHERIFEMVAEAKKNRYEGGKCDYRGVRLNGEPIWVHIRLFFLREQDGHAFFYGTLSDVTDIYEKNELLAEQNQMLNFLNSDMPGGYYRHKHDNGCEFTYISDRFLDIFGYTRGEIVQEFDNKFINMVHPEDREALYEALDALDENGGNYSQSYRMRSKNGYIVILDQSRKMVYNDQKFFQGLVLCDIEYMPSFGGTDSGASELHSEEDDSIMKWMPCGVFKYDADNAHQLTYISDSLLTMLGYSREAFDEKFRGNANNLMYKDDRDGVIRDIKEQMKTSNYLSCEYRMELADGSLKWVYSRSQIIPDKEGKRWCYTCITDSDYLKQKYEDRQWQQMKYQVAMPGSFVFEYLPESDLLTGELFSQDGTLKKFKFKDFVNNITTYKWLDQDTIREQKKTFRAAMESPMCCEAEFRVRLGAGDDFRWYRARYTSMENRDGVVDSIVGRAENIDREVKQIADWKTRAMTDLMTGLLNDNAGRERIEILLNRHQGGTMILLDIDNFEELNGRNGRAWGDKVIREFAEVIREDFRREDILARLKGDKFLIFMPEVTGREIVEARMYHLREMIHAIGDREKEIRCSAGIAVTGEKKASVDLMLRRAEAALYQSKKEGKDRYTFFVE